MTVISRIEAFADELKTIRHDLHAYPEIGFEEERTSSIVAEALESYGIEVHRNIGGTGVVGMLAGDREGRMIGLRADMDALPMDETTDLAYRSTITGRFHGCGHDGHTTILLGAARYLAEQRQFAGTVVFIFQPAEEGLGGARAMLADDLFGRFPCEEVYALHNMPSLEPGQIGLFSGKAMAGAYFFDIQIKACGSHAAMPDASKDPIVIASALAQSLQSIVSRNVPPMKQAVLSITQMHAGSAYNVIPEHATLAGTIRFFDDQVGELIGKRLRTMAAGFAQSYDVEVDVDIRDIFTVLENHPAETNALYEAAVDIVGADNVLTEPRPVMGSEDFADMLQAVPGAYCWVGHGGTLPLHNPGFILDDDMLPIGASLLARVVEKQLDA